MSESPCICATTVLNNKFSGAGPGFHDRGHDFFFAGNVAVGDQPFDRADHAADHAAEAMVVVGNRPALFAVPAESLPARILADDVTLPAADAFVEVEISAPLAREVESVGGNRVFERLSDYLREILELFVVHPV